MKSLRILMGVGIVSILVPAMAIVVPDQFAAINPFDSGDDASTAIAATSPPDFSDRVVARGEEGEAMSNPTDPIVGSDPPPEFDVQEVNDSNSEGSETKHDHNTEPSQATAPSESTSSTKPKTTTTIKESSDADSSQAVTADGTITGDACPCKVTGTVELKGEVNLKGDLMVDGGTLVARSGVTVNGNRFQIMFMNGGKADFQGTKTSTWSGNGSNANLSRDVAFRNLRRIMFHHTGPSTLRYVSVIDSGTNGVEDDYPLHWHFSGDSSRGTVVEGVVVVNGQNRAYVPHASHGITFRDIIAKNTLGSQAFWWNTTRMDPCSSDSRGNCTLNDSHDIKIDHALIDGVTGPGTRVAGFVMGQGKNNSLINSATRNIGSSGSCSGYLWDPDTHGDWFFSNNAAFSGSCKRAIFHWQNRDDGEIIQNLRSELSIDHGAYRNRHEYRNIDVPLFIAHALSFTVRDSRIGHVVIERHPTTGGEPTRFINVTIQKVSVRDARDNPGVYIFDNTNIGCGDVDLAEAHPGSEVIVNGVDCNES